jgi:hypothetical protein
MKITKNDVRQTTLSTNLLTLAEKPVAQKPVDRFERHGLDRAATRLTELDLGKKPVDREGDLLPNEKLASQTGGKADFFGSDVPMPGSMSGRDRPSMGDQLGSKVGDAAIAAGAAAFNAIKEAVSVSSILKEGVGLIAGAGTVAEIVGAAGAVGAAGLAGATVGNLIDETYTALAGETMADTVYEKMNPDAPKPAAKDPPPKAAEGTEGSEKPTEKPSETKPAEQKAKSSMVPGQESAPDGVLIVPPSRHERTGWVSRRELATRPGVEEADVGAVNQDAIARRKTEGVTTPTETTKIDKGARLKVGVRKPLDTVSRPVNPDSENPEDKTVRGPRGPKPVASFLAQRRV